MSQRSSDRLVIALDLFAAVVVGYLLVRPGGPLRNAYEHWQSQRRDRQLLSVLFDSLTANAPQTAPGIPTVVEFTDYECPVCRAAHQALRARPAFPIAIRQFPLPSHPHARRAAIAAFCSVEQGSFASMHRRLLESSDWLTGGTLTAEARAAGIPDTIAFNACLHSKAAEGQVDQDIAYGNRVGITGTPTFFDRARRYVGMLPADATPPVHTSAR